MTTDPTPLFSRLWVYQRERFPLAAHGLLTAAFAGGVMCAGAALSGRELSGLAVGAAVFLALGLFFQLRVADEWKDLETDTEHRPQRPVPRGLVTLGELSVIAVLIALAQLAVAVSMGGAVVGALVLAWAFAALMTAEFFAPERLRQSTAWVLVSHGLVVPLIALVALACVLGGAEWPRGALWILAASFFAGNAVEVGRKVRAPEDEQPGVETYSAAWGPRRALAVWLGAAFAASACVGAILDHAGAPVWPAIALGGIALALALPAMKNPASSAMGRMETGAALWVLALYLVLGPLTYFLWA